MPSLGRLLGGSYRGAPFSILAHDSIPAGRRIQNHEYPGRDGNYAEDLGRRTGEFEVSCFVIGGSHHLRRDALIAACGRPGPGVLIHPYLGVKRVVCTECNVTEQANERRMARFTLRFIAAGANSQPAAAVDTAELVAGAAAALQSALASEFVSRFGL